MKSTSNVRAAGRVRVEAHPLASDEAYVAAESAFRSGCYERCRLLLQLMVAHDRSTADFVCLLEARAARADDDVEAWHAAADRAYRDHPDAAARLEGLALRGLAQRRRNRAEAAAADFKRLHDLAALDPAAAPGWPEYYLALDAFSRGELDDAAERVQRNLDAEIIVAPSLALLGEVEAERVDIRRAGSLYLDALMHEHQAPERDLRLLCDLIAATSRIAAATVDLALGRSVRAHFDEAVWPASAVAARFEAVTAFRDLSLLEGRLDDAWLFAREAAVKAPDDAHAVIGEVNAAAVSFIIGDSAATRFQFAHAWNRLSAAPAHHLDRDWAAALVHFAYEAAREMPDEAHEALKRCERYALEHGDRRTVAFEILAKARVAETTGDLGRAKRLYRDAFGHFQALHLDLRAAIVALDLERVTGETSYRAAVAPILDRIPSAWFVQRPKRLSDLLPEITPAETAVLALLLEGKSARTIAHDLDRSVHTINNHTRKIFKAFGVTSRSAVLARCTALGITPSHFKRRPVA